MSSLDTRKIDLIALGIIILLVAITYFAFIREGRANVAVLKEKEKMLLENVHTSGDMNLELEKIADEIEDIQKNLEKFDRQLPDEKRIYDVLVEIDTLAKGNNVSLKSIQPGALEKGALYSWVPITLSGSSGFKDFYRFLFQLENIPRITMTERLRVQRLPEGNSCSLEMDLAVFVGGK